MNKYDHPIDKCIHCRKEIFQNKRGTVKYCSDKCRMAASRDRNRTSRRLATMCETCNKQFYPIMPRYLVKYCSSACRQKAYRASKRGER